MAEGQGGFNPLHCGAVVASPLAAWRGRARRKVSIPFIAGQWSLQPERARRLENQLEFQSPSLRGSGRFLLRLGRGYPDPPCFNPLHCGAVVASRRTAGGQGGPHGKFQSPSLRGSGRFLAASSRRPAPTSCFNPLHCGAVVASRAVLRHARAPRVVSIPFIAGQWSLRTPPAARRVGKEEVSIPFIAGQWSLRAQREAERAQREVSIPFIAGQWSLHGGGGQGGKHNGSVSIPFIAGQWSLRPPSPEGGRAIRLFQSPSLRGSGRFLDRPPPHGGGARRFQSPSLRGSGRFPPRRMAGAGKEESFNPLHCGAVVASTRARTAPRESTRVSIPFIAGQWSLPS
jgi:hypothetical protein